MCLKEYRASLNITAKDAAFVANMPYRTYFRYEQDEHYGSPLKRKAIYEVIKDKFEKTEEKGLLTLQEIKDICESVLSQYENKVEYCYLFGSYAKGYAKENSDVDLFVSTTLTGLSFIGLIEELRTSLKKKVDLIRLADTKDNLELLNEIMKDGIKIYG